MNRHQTVLLMLALILMPLLAWTLVSWGQKVSLKKTMERQRAEVNEIQAAKMELLRLRHGIEPGKRLNLPFSFQVVQPLPPGELTLLWVAPRDPDCHEHVLSFWRALLAECPWVSLMGLYSHMEKGEWRALGAGFPMGKMLLTSSGFLTDVGLDHGAYLLLDQEWTVIWVSQTDDPCEKPSSAEVQRLVELAVSKRRAR